jgi:hypothetical protein
MKVVVDRPMRSVVVVIVSVVAALAMGVLGYGLGRFQQGGLFKWYGGYEVQQDAQRAVELERKLADIQLSQVIDGDANESLRQTIKSLRDELSASQEEVLFYRQLMAPSEAQRGLRIEKFEVTKGGSAAEVKYRLLLAQVVERHDWASGTVTVDVAGTWENEQVVLPLTELTQVDPYPLTFRFRYLQDFTGTLAIPAGLSPERVVITAATSGKGAKRVQKTFSWMVAED